RHHPFEKPIRIGFKDFVISNWQSIIAILLIWILLTVFVITLMYALHKAKTHKETLLLLKSSLETQKKLEESERRFKALAEQFPGAVFIAKDDPKLSIIYITQQIEDLTGYKKEIFLSGELSILELTHNEDRDYVLSEREEKLKEKKPYQLTYRLLTKDEKWIWVCEMGTGIWDDSKLLYIQGYIWDVTQAKVEEEIKKRKLERTNIEREILIEVMARPEVEEGDFDSLSRFITESIGIRLKIPRVNVWLFNDDQTQLICVDHYDLSTGIHSRGMILKEEEFSAEFSALKVSKYVDAEDALNDPRTKGYSKSYLIPLNITSMLDVSIRIGEKNRGVICLEYTQSPHKWEEDEITFTSQVADQLALTLINKEKKNYEIQRDLLIRTIETSEHGMIIFDSKGIITYINPVIYSLLNILPENYINKSIENLIEDGLPIDNLREKLKEVEKGKIHKERLEIKKDNTLTLILECSISSILNVYGATSHFVLHITNITKEVKLENDLRQAQKMESIGQLAGGLAHDINNHLLVIQGYSELIESEIPDNSPILPYLREMKNANLKASSLVKQLLAFARKQLLKKEVISLNNIIENTKNLIRRVIKENIEIETILKPNLPNVYADRNAIEIIIINLCTNANDAMPNGGKIIIETNRAYLSKEVVEGIPWVKEGEFVTLTITDNGVGMDKNTLEHCFEPFFTTKESSKGTGLGLSTVYGLIQQHEGMIHVYSEPGRGTTFKIYIPITDLPKSEEKVENTQTEILTGSETILLAEDEPAVRAVTTRILEQAGYNVISAENGEEAFKLFIENEDKIQLVILDIVMPLLSGKEVYEKIKAINPEIPVLFTSGYSENSIHTNFILHEGYQIIQKPYGRTEILKEIRKVFDRKKQK
ncbi:MAG: response regulator, partial [Candidatus Hydrogenedentes bacterium]|nr:response regulator [Candidatus Hydrogenedentota bacterium]